MTHIDVNPSLGALADPGESLQPISVVGIEPDEAVDLLRTMVRIRLAEEKIAELSSSGEVACPCHLAIGQEAAAVGVARALEQADVAFGAHRSHGHYLAMGGSLDGLFAEIFGKETGCSGGFGGSMHLIAPDHGLLGTVPIVGATIPMAIGAAWAAKHRATGGVAVAFFGDGATEEGVFHESCNLAQALSAPAVLVCENNLFSSHLAIELRQPFNSVGRYGVVHGLQVRTVNGNDVVAVRAAMSELVAMARKGEPGLLEAVTFRWRGHVGPREDLDVGVGRSMEELAAWKNRDCIAGFAKACVADGILTADSLAAIRGSEMEQVEAAVEHARKAPYPDEGRMYDVVYTPVGTSR